MRRTLLNLSHNKQQAAGIALGRRDYWKENMHYSTRFCVQLFMTDEAIKWVEKIIPQLEHFALAAYSQFELPEETVAIKRN